MTTLRKYSKADYSANLPGAPNRDELKLGALQRIADATKKQGRFDPPAICAAQRERQ